MAIDAERDSGPRWASHGDDRVTSTGKLIRRFRVDELPQLMNVIRGEMSIVGPRPERPEFVDLLTAEFPIFRHRHCVRPGLTGWAQLSYPYGSSVMDAREKLCYDLYYIKNASLLLDMVILLQTLEVVMWGKAVSMAGSYKAPEPEPSASDESGRAQLSSRETPSKSSRSYSASDV